MATRNAASVLPDPVGAAMSVSLPAATACQPKACASVGPAGYLRRNHSATAGWKPANGSVVASIGGGDDAAATGGLYPNGCSLAPAGAVQGSETTGNPGDLTRHALRVPAQRTRGARTGRRLPVRSPWL